MSNNIERATEGTTYAVDDTWFEVGPSCEGNTGCWHCLTHKRTFMSQLDKDGHIGRGDHVLVWICLEHGPEVP